MIRLFIYVVLKHLGITFSRDEHSYIHSDYVDQFRFHIFQVRNFYKIRLFTNIGLKVVRIIAGSSLGTHFSYVNIFLKQIQIYLCPQDPKIKIYKT